MSGFYDRRFDLLLSTNIIESGLDIPSANTLIVHRPDMFGLSQLYQLRGRIGRSKVRGYAYLTLPPGRLLSPAAEKRLGVMQTLDSLGAGFTLANGGVIRIAQTARDIAKPGLMPVAACGRQGRHQLQPDDLRHAAGLHVDEVENGALQEGEPVRRFSGVVQRALDTFQRVLDALVEKTLLVRNVIIKGAARDPQ